MLSVEGVKDLIEMHQKKAAAHIERLKAKIETEGDELCGWVRDEDVAVYWSHSDVMYLPLNSCDFINFFSKKVLAVSFIESLEVIKNTDFDRLEKLYFEHVYYCWIKEGLVRSKVSKGLASEEFLNRVFKA